MLTRKQIEQIVKFLLKRYDAEYALLFGSYARGEETPESDIDIIVFGGDGFKKTNIFAFAEELRTATGKAVDAFEICEVNSDSEFYRNAVNEGIKIA